MFSKDTTILQKKIKYIFLFGDDCILSLTWDERVPTLSILIILPSFLFFRIGILAFLLTELELYHPNKKSPNYNKVIGAFKKRRLSTLPLCSSTIDVDRLNFSVRNGKRWNPVAITT